MTTFEEDFQTTWLMEMPKKISPLNSGLFSSIVNNLQEFIQAGLEKINLGNGYFKLQGAQVAFYWHETNNVIDIVTELGIRPQALVVHQTAKNPEAISKSFATDLYLTILKSSDSAIMLMSDEYLTEQGLLIWKRLVNLGNTISIYDRENPKDLIHINTEPELMKFINETDPSFKKYQFGLSDTKQKLAETKILFNTKRLRVLSGYP